jgi:MoaA/NifB/PqqE/SkfB family radical SAM enzyme
MPSAAAFAGRRCLEVALDYRCNLRCLGCHACHDSGERLSSGQALATMKAARSAGVGRMWFGGGEPTLRDDLISLVREARRLGFNDVVLQTNGMRLAYPAYRDALLAAGVTEVRLNVKSHAADVHDRLSGGERCHALLLEALDGLAPARDRGVRVVADVLLARSTLGDLAATVTFFAARGVGAFVLWLLSAADAPAPEVRAEVPRIADVVPALGEARAAAARAGAELSSLHTPPCTLPPELRELYLPASALALSVVGPDARAFPLEASRFEGNAFAPACARCAARPRCGGPRADYLAIHGDRELLPLPA